MTRRSFSSVDSAEEAAAAAEAAKLKIEPEELTVKPKALFPWRHETSENLLPRLEFDSPEYRADVRLPNDIQAMLAVFFLGVPVWRVFFGTGWRDELAESCAFAFKQGTAGIISNVYNVPFTSLLKDDDKLEFCYPESLDSEAPDVENQEDASKGPSESESVNIVISDETTEKESTLETSQSTHKMSSEGDKKVFVDETDAPDVTHMLDRPLRRLFQSAHESGRDQLLIKLKSEPKRAMLYTVFGIPFLTKRQAEADTSLLNRVRDLLALIRTDSDTAFAGINDIIRQGVSLPKEKMETTIEVQVLVECEEEFQVMDRKSGILLQGPEDGLVRSVIHLVRLETVATWRGKFPSLPSRTLDNWIITDIDDLVGCKKWYHKH